MINETEIRQYMNDRSCVELTDNLLRMHLPLNAYYPLMGYVGLMELIRGGHIGVQPIALYVYGKSSPKFSAIAAGLYADNPPMPVPLCAMSLSCLQSELLNSNGLLSYEAWSMYDDRRKRTKIEINLDSIARSMDCLTRASVIVTGEHALQLGASAIERYYQIDVGTEISRVGDVLSAIEDGTLMRFRAAFSRHLNQIPGKATLATRMYSAAREELRGRCNGIAHSRRLHRVAALMVGWDMIEDFRCRTLHIPRDPQRLREACRAIGFDIDLEVQDHD